MGGADPARAGHPGPGRRGLVAALLLAAIVAGLGCYGLGSGGKFYFKVVQAPLQAAAHAPYYRDSILHVGLAYCLGLGSSLLGFRVFVLGWYWAGLARTLAAAAARLSATDTALVALVLVLHPSAMIVHTWTCHPDALTYCLTALLMFARGPGWTAVVAGLGAWNHLAMWLVICGQTALLWFAFSGAQARARAAALLVGLAIGAASCKLLLGLAGVHIAADRFALAAGQEWRVLAGYWSGPGPAVVYSLHFAHLLWLPALLLRLRARGERRGALALAAAQLLALAAAFFAQDTTRVFALLGWGSLVYGLVHALAASAREGPRGRASSHLRALVGVAAVVTLLAPKFFAWKGELHAVDGARAHLRALLF